MQIPPAAQQFIEGLCNLDISQISGSLSEDAKLSAIGSVSASGKSRVRSALIHAMGAIYSIQCEPAVVWMKRDVAIIEADVVWERMDRARVSLPVTIILHFRDHLIVDIRLLTYEPAIGGSAATPCMVA